jgi:Tfp pilus assembly ATPase PilU
LHTGFASYAAVAVEINYPIVTPEKGRHRTDCYARRVVALIAAKHGEEAPRVRVLALFYVLDPGAKSAKRDFIFRFAGDGTGVTADTLAVVYDEAISHIF